MADINYAGVFIGFLGGIGLFLYGMHVMASGLQRSAGAQMKKLLEALTKTKLLGVIVGVFVTGIIQSSSATTVMVVGFVNAGLMNLTQSVGVIMGANIGTTVTSWLVASVEWAQYLNPSNFAPVAVALGAAMAIFGGKDRVKLIGETLVGFGILFMGMNQMSQAAVPLRESEFFRQAFVVMGSNPLLGILAGAVVTGIIQSSSASVGILQSLALAGLVPWNAAVYIIMGQNIGTCVTALLSSIGASRTARSAAYIHLLFNVIGSILFGALSIVYFSMINPDVGNALITITQIGIVHTSFNVANTVIMYPFSNMLIFLAEKMTRAGKQEVDEGEVIHLDDRVLETPAFAIENAVKEIVRMGYMALENLNLAKQAVLGKDKKKIDTVLKREKNIDILERAITGYLVKICNADISQDENTLITSLFHTVNDVERVGDHCENIAELAEFAVQEDLRLSEAAFSELQEITDMTISCYENSIISLEKNDREKARLVVEEEDSIDVLEKNLRNAHMRRLANSECDTSAGVVFLDMLTNLERISDHALNIAQTVLHEKPKKV